MLSFGQDNFEPIIALSSPYVDPVKSKAMCTPQCVKLQKIPIEQTTTEGPEPNSSETE
jgi:hypothetical protein